MNLFKFFLVAVFLAVSAGSPRAALSAPELPEELKDKDPQTLMSVGFGLMQLNDSEKEEFGEIIRDFAADVRGTIARESRRNLPNIDRRIRSRVKRLYEELDERVGHIVTEARRPGYLVFKKGLADQLTPQS